MEDTAIVIDVQVVGDHRLRLTFAPSFSAELDFSGPNLKGAPAELLHQANFEQVVLDPTLGRLVWPDSGYTINADTLYERVKSGGGLPPSGPPPAGGADGPSGAPSFTTVAGAVASGLGVLGFVTFAGGVVLWSRFKEMGLPADHALGLVPKSELVATGAEFLVPAVLLSLLVVLIAVLISRWIDRRDLRTGHRPERQKAIHQGLKESRRVVAPLFVGVGGIVLSLLTLTAVPSSALVILIGVSLLGALAVRACGRFSYPAFCLIAFLAVGAIVIARTYERTSHRLEVLPMAYSRAQPGEPARVEVGYFLAETSDRILFASQPEGIANSPNELREFPRGETDDLEIGELAPPQQAERDAAHFAFNLCERLALLTPLPATGARTAKKAKAAPVCPRSYLKHFATTAGLPWRPNHSERLEERLAEELKGCRTESSHAPRVACERRAHKQFDPKQQKQQQQKKKTKKRQQRQSASDV